MSRVFMIADLHFKHENMAIKRGFKNSEEHDKQLVENWNSVVHKNDTVYILGDITFEKSLGYSILRQLKGNKKVILGNHDKASDVKELLNYVHSVCGCVKYKGFILTHIPIHESELKRFRGNIHGHLHEITIDHWKYFNVSCEQINYTPILFDTLIEEL